MTHEELLECAMDLAIEVEGIRQRRALAEEFRAEIAQESEGRGERLLAFGVRK